MTVEPDHFSLQEMADAMELLRAGRVDRVGVLRKQAAEHKTRRSIDDIDRLARVVPLLARAALVFRELAARREEAPRWIVALIEAGEVE